MRHASGGFEADLDAALDARGLPARARAVGSQESIDILCGRREVQLQLHRPGAYLYPGLPQRRYYERDEFSWAKAVEARVSEMRAEFQTRVESGRNGFRPNMLSDPARPLQDVHSLIDSPDWSTLWLRENGAALAEHVEQLPVTFNTLMALDLPRITMRAPPLLLSRLSLDAHPHRIPALCRFEDILQ